MQVVNHEIINNKYYSTCTGNEVKARFLIFYIGSIIIYSTSFLYQYRLPPMHFLDLSVFQILLLHFAPNILRS